MPRLTRLVAITDRRCSIKCLFADFKDNVVLNSGGHFELSGGHFICVVAVPTTMGTCLNLCLANRVYH